MVTETSNEVLRASDSAMHEKNYMLAYLTNGSRSIAHTVIALDAQ